MAQPRRISKVDEVWVSSSKSMDSSRGLWGQLWPSLVLYATTMDKTAAYFFL